MRKWRLHVNNKIHLYALTYRFPKPRIKKKLVLMISFNKAFHIHGKKGSKYNFYSGEDHISTIPEEILPRYIRKELGKIAKEAYEDE